MTALEEHLLARVAELEAELAPYRAQKEKNRRRMQNRRTIERPRTNRAQTAHSASTDLVLETAHCAGSHDRSSAGSIHLLTDTSFSQKSKSTISSLLTTFVKSQADEPLVIPNECSASQETLFPDQPKQPVVGGGGAAKKAGLEWMREIRAILKRHYGVEPSGKWWGNLLKPLVAQHGIAAVEGELDAYCAITPMTYVNSHKFTEFFGGWAGERDRKLAGALVPNRRLSASEQTDKAIAELLANPAKYSLTPEYDRSA